MVDIATICGIVSVMAIDTLAISGKLRAAGFTEAQAEAQVESLQEATDGAVTKRDLHRAIKGLESRIGEKITQSEVRSLRHITFALFGALTIMTAIFTVLVKYL